MNKFTKSQKRLVTWYRLKDINHRLKHFSTLPLVLQTNEYRNRLLKYKDELMTSSISFSDKSCLCLIKQSKKEIEQNFECQVVIEKNKTCMIFCDDYRNVKRVKIFIKNIIHTNIQPESLFDITRMSDWEKFYVWWYYFSNK